MSTRKSKRSQDPNAIKVASHISLKPPTGKRPTSRYSTASRASSVQSIPQYKPIKVCGQGAFGVVYSARAPDGSVVAVKKVLQDPRYKNRELETMLEIQNRYCVCLKSHFKTSGKKPNEVFLNLVMEYMPISLHQFNIGYRKERKYPPILYIKLFAYQMFAGLHYLHSSGITHRDLKPQNILCDSSTGELKICDFGSAKRLHPKEKSVSYIASRYYRAPELIFDCVLYTSAIDIWAAGCVVAEMLLAGMPIFPGQSPLGQLHEIVKVIGPPTEAELQTFQHTAQHTLSPSASITLKDVLPRHTPPDLLDLLTRIFIYSPGKRPSALDCMNHETFGELFDPELTMPSGRPFPTLERQPIEPKANLTFAETNE